MSRTIDQKVVQMQFDNQNFEQNAKQSMSTLEKLKAALKFDGANKGVEELNKSVKGLDFGQAEIMATKAGFHIQDVFLKISNVLEYQIARKIINIGENIAKSLTLDQVKAGFSEYELKMGSIQTIMAGTGESLAVVNKYLNELNEYSDKTIYSFSDMTQNIGKFTNAGVKLKDAVAAIQGVANVAAVSGANAQEASRAMYNFAQALSAGYVKLIDWKSIENANMATVEFKDTLLQVATAMGKAESKGDGMYKILTRNAQGKEMKEAVSATKNFNDSLQHQWMTTEVLTQTLEIYSKDVRAMTDEERKLYEEKLEGIGFTKEQIYQFEQLGIKATKAASEVKTFSQLIDTIKESIGSGWAMSFEHIIGNFEEAKELFTEISEGVGLVIGRMDSQRNKMLENWKRLGGRKDLIQGFRNLAEAITSIFTPVKKVFDELFGRLDSKKLVEITKGFKDWTASLILNKDQQEALRVTLHYLLIPIKVIVETIKVILKLIPSLLSIGADVIKLLLQLTQYLILTIKNSDTFKTIVAKLKEGFELLKTGIISVIKFLKELATTVYTYVIDSLKDSNSWLSKTIDFLKILGAISLAGLKAAFNSIANFKFSNITDSLEKMKTKIIELSESSKVVKFLLDSFEKVKAGLTVLGDTVMVVVNHIASQMEKVQSFGDFLKLIWDALKDGYEYLKEFIESKFFTDGPGLFDTIKKAFTDFISVLEGGLKNIPWAKLVLIGFSLALVSCTINLVTAISRFGGLAMALRETINIINTTIKTFTTLRNRLIELKEIAIFIATLTLAVGLLTYLEMNGGNVVKAASVLGILAGGLMIIAEAMLWINTKNALAPASLASLFASLAAIAAGVAILVAAAAALKDMSLSLKAAMPYIKTLGVLMAGMLAAMTVLTLIGKDHKVFTAGALSILSYASGVYILCKGLTQLANIKFADINSLLKLLAATFGGFAVIIALTGTFEHKLLKFNSNAWAILAFAVSLKIVASALNDISNLHLSQDAKKVLDTIIDLVKYFGTIIVVATTLSKIFGKANDKTKAIKKHSNKFAKSLNALSLSLIAASASLFIIVKTFEEMKNNLQTGQDWAMFGATILSFVGIIAAMVGAFAIIVKLTKNSALVNKNAFLKFSIAVVALSASLVPISLCLDLLTEIVSQHDGKDVGIAAGIIGGLGIVMAALMAAAGKLKLTSFKAILSVFAGMTLLMADLVAMSLIVDANGDAVLAALGSMIIIAGLMAGLFAALPALENKLGTFNIKNLITIVGSLTVLAGVLVGLTFLADSGAGDKIFTALEALGGIAVIMGVTFGSFAWIEKHIGKLGSIIPELIAITGSMTILSGVLVGLALIIKEHGDAVNTALVKMGFIGLGLVTLYGIFAAIDKYSDGGSWASLLSLAAVLVAVAGGLYVLAQVPWDKLKDAGLAIGLVLLEFSGFAVALGVLNAILPGTAPLLDIFTFALSAVVAAMAAVVAAAGYFATGVSKIVNSLVNLGNNADKVADGIKKAGHAIAEEVVEIAQAFATAGPRIAAAIANIMVGIAAGINEGAPLIASAIAQVITTLMPVIEEGLRTIGSMLLEGIMNLVSGLGNTFGAFVDAGASLLGAFVSGLLDAVGLGNIAGAAGEWVTKIISTLAKAFPSIYSIGNALKNGFFSSATPTQSDVNGWVNEYHSADKAMAGAVLGDLTVTEKEIRKKSQTIPAGVVDNIKKAGTEGSKYAKKATDDINNSFFTGWKENEKINFQLKGQLQSLTSKFADFGNTAKGLASGGLSAIVDYGKDKLMPFFNEFTALPEQLTKELEKTTQAATGAGQGLEDLGKGAGKAAKGVKEAKDEMSSFVEKMEQSFNILDEFDLGLDEENPLTGDKLLDNMRSNIDGMNTWAHEMVSIAGKVPEGLYKKLADMGPQGYKYVHAFAQMTQEELNQVQVYYAQSLMIPYSVTAQVYQGMALTASNAYTGFVNGLNIPAMKQNGIQMATTLLDGIATGLDSHSPSRKTYQQGTYATKGLANGVKDPSAKEGLMYTISNMCREMIEKYRLGLKASNFRQIGEQVTDGLSQGIRSGESDVINAAADVCRAAVIEARRTLKIKSPSRVFKEIGKYIDAGLAEGVTSNIGMVETSIETMSNTTIENMRDAVATLQTIVDSDLDCEPVIRPVVDLSNVQNGVNSVNSLMGMNFGTNVTLPSASFMQTSQLVSNTDNTDVVTSINSLKEDIGSLKSAISSIKVVLDSGTMVGAMVNDIDSALGKKMVYAGRGM